MISPTIAIIAARAAMSRLRSSAVADRLERLQYDPPPMRLTSWLKLGLVGLVTLIIAVTLIRHDAKKQALETFADKAKLVAAEDIAKARAANEKLIAANNALRAQLSQAEDIRQRVDAEEIAAIAALQAQGLECRLSPAGLASVNDLIQRANK